MRVTATNGNARNLIEGQRVTVRLNTGAVFSKVLPAGNAIKRKRYAAELIDFIRVAAILELVERHKPRTSRGADLVRLFALNKAQRVVLSGHRGEL